MTDLIRFRSVFKDLTGYAPFPWQELLYVRFMGEGRENNIPTSCNLPTGLGKTAVIPIWLIALADNPQNVPRRLVYVVNRRTVVDQASAETEKIRASLTASGRSTRLEALADRLASLAADPTAGPLAISTLRGQFADNGEWRADPARPAVVVGTIDMIGSRLLFSGYGCGFKSRPLHAAFLGQDALLIHDEAHLEPAFQQLLMGIQQEQKKGRTPDRWPLRIMELTATSRGQEEPFELTDEEKNPPDVLPAQPTKPVEVVWRRLKAKKRLTLAPTPDERGVVAKMIELALAHKDSNEAILVFARTLQAVEDIRKGLAGKGKVSEESILPLNGTIRGLERDRMAKEDPVFARFYRQSQANAKSGTVYLICTSAGEVGVDISADHMVCDLTPFDSMAQRFGRVNRFGDGDAEIHVVHEGKSSDKKKDDPFDRCRWLTLSLLQSLPKYKDGCRDASPKALSELDPKQRQDAFTPTPIILPASDILFDAWALTTIRDKLPGRPPVEPYLHGVADWEPPKTQVAWRQEVQVITADLLEKYRPEDLLEDYPLKPHELLRDDTDRVHSRLDEIAAGREQLPVWVVDQQGGVVPMTLGDLTARKVGGKKSDYLVDIANRTVVLPPAAGGLRDDGMLAGNAQPSADGSEDVADQWTVKVRLGQKEVDQMCRRRVWEGPQADDKTPGMRLIRRIRFPAADDDAEGRSWLWFERSANSDNDGSNAAASPVLWQVHADDVLRNAARIVQALGLPKELHEAVTLAARFHDLGKKRRAWQRSIGNPNPMNWLAKSGGKMRPTELSDYRHELGSLLDVLHGCDGSPTPEFAILDDNTKELVLHLIASHHGRARPHFPQDETYDPEKPDADSLAAVCDVPRRFARLQRKYGRWGLAYLESLLRAADYAASAAPSASVEEEDHQP